MARTPKFKKSFVNESFYTKCREWLTNGHWVIKVSAYADRLPRTFTENLREPMINNILPKQGETLYPLEWTAIGVSSPHDNEPDNRYGIIRLKTKNKLIAAQPYYLDALDLGNLSWWASESDAPMYATGISATFDAAYIVAILMPVQVSSKHANDARLVADLLADLESKE